MIEHEKTPAGVYVRLGPFETDDEAQRVEDLLRALCAEGWALAQRPGWPANVEAAVEQGLRHLKTTDGHFSVRVDGGPEAKPKVDYSAGGTFRSARRIAEQNTLDSPREARAPYQPK